LVLLRGFVTMYGHMNVKNWSEFSLKYNSFLPSKSGQRKHKKERS